MYNEYIFIMTWTWIGKCCAPVRRFQNSGIQLTRPSSEKHLEEFKYSGEFSRSKRKLIR